MRDIPAAALLVGLLTLLPAYCLAQPGPVSSRGATDSRRVATQRGVHATKGVVTFVDADRLVITRSPQYGRPTTFLLNPSTERVGSVTVGSTVDIRYRTESKQQVATAVTVVHAKLPPVVHACQYSQ
jgi:hypothetical protein